MLAGMSLTTPLNAETKSELENATWQLQQYLGDTGQMQQASAYAVISATFKDGKLSGNAGCNNYFGSYAEAHDQAIRFSKTGSTRMACPPPVMQQEHTYLSLLSAVSSYQIQDERLMFSDADLKPVLQYIASTVVTLENTAWQAAGINNGRGGVVSSKTTSLTNALFVDGKISGNAGCNQFSATYEILNDQLVVGPAIATRRHCAEPEGIMQQEQEYLQALSKASTYRLDANGMELRDTHGSLQVRFIIKKDQ